MRIGSTTPRSHETVTAEPRSAGVDSLRSLGLDVQVNQNQGTIERLKHAEIVRGVDIHGLVHISRGRIEQFEEGKGVSGKFGEGTYFAAGNLTGETYDLLSTPGNVAHAASAEGLSVLFVNRSEIRELDSDLKERAGIPTTKLKTTIRNANITDLSSQAGLEIDSVVIFMDDERTAAEVIVLPHATSQITVTDRKVL